MVSIGVVITWLVVTAATHWLLDFSWQLSFLFGAVMVVTGPTVITPMLKTVRPTSHIANVLRWEGIVIDPIGALLAVLVYEFLVSSSLSTAFTHTLLTFVKIIGLGVILGAATGYLFGVVLRRHWLPDYLHNVAALGLVLAVFGLSNAMQEESGLLTVTVMGMWLANMKGVPTKDILHFKESLSVLLISALFIILAARIDFTQLQQLGWAALGVFAAIQFVARPLKVAVATYGSKLNWRERALLGWVAPRGIVAAAISALFAIRLGEYNFDQAYLLVPLTFMAIIGTVVLQSATSSFIAQWLGVREPEPRGFLIIGANIVARTIAKALLDNGFRVQLTDTVWDNVHTARLEGFAVYYGSAVSQHADRHLDLVGVGRMFGLSPQSETNALAALKYQGEFGRKSVYTIASSAESKGLEHYAIAEQHRGRVLFNAELSYAKFASLLSKGATIETEELKEDYDFAAYRETHANGAIELFALDPNQNIHIFTTDQSVEPRPGWKVTSLIINAEPGQKKD
jgi:NhaP-type Na+/H+ or K+/H+ antiporter